MELLGILTKSWMVESLNLWYVSLLLGVQVHALTSQADEQSKEIDSLKKSAAETNALLHQLISFNNGMSIIFTIYYR
jgi:hypothetical protein